MPCFNYLYHLLPTRCLPYLLHYMYYLRPRDMIPRLVCYFLTLKAKEKRSREFHVPLSICISSYLSLLTAFEFFDFWSF